jgi:uncharacterized protein
MSSGMALYPIVRIVERQLKKRLNDNKVLIFLGPRQVGKTTLLKKLAQGLEGKHLWWNADEPDIRAELDNATSTLLMEKIGDARVVFIDEAQRIRNIGLLLKLGHDNLPDVKFIVTGSSVLELSSEINEPLTGRKWEFQMYPLSASELHQHFGEREEHRLLSHRLVYGSYPDVVNNPGDALGKLSELAGSYLYKDLLTWENIKKPQQLEKLLQALAFQVGQIVSVHELGQLTGLDFHTVERYLSLLHKTFVIYSLSPFSRNLRNEIKKSRKIYFYDNGIRNAILNQFGPLELRNDKGQLWENFLMAERMKYNAYHDRHVSSFFWRNHAQQEIDCLEEGNGQLEAYEFKWAEKSWKIPGVFCFSLSTSTF